MSSSADVPDTHSTLETEMFVLQKEIERQEKRLSHDTLNSKEAKLVEFRIQFLKSSLDDLRVQNSQDGERKG